MVHYHQMNNVVSRCQTPPLSDIGTAGKHSAPCRAEDKKQIIKELIQNDTLSFVSGRKHSTFPKFKCNVMKGMNKDKIVTWMMGHYREILSEIVLQNRC